MQIERARRLLRQRPEFAVVPQRMMQVVEQLLDYIQQDDPSLRLTVNAGAVADQIGRSKSAVIDALTWLVDFEFAAMERAGDNFWLELQPQFLQPLGLTGRSERDKDTACVRWPEADGRPVIPRKCG